MTLDEILSRTESMLTKYEQLCREEASLYQDMADAESDYDALSARLAVEEEPAAIQRIQAQIRQTAERMQRSMQRLEVVKREIGECRGLLTQAGSLLGDAIRKLESEIAKVDQTISAFGLLSQQRFGGGEAAAQIPVMQRKRDGYQAYLNRAYDDVARIDRALNGSGDSYVKTYHP